MDKDSLGLQDRNVYLLEMVRELLLSEVAFQEIARKYKKDHLRFTDVGNLVDDQGQSILYNLKEQCHSLFRHGGKGPLHKKEWLLDLAIGSLFHEAMKLRENLYQAEAYRPKYLEYKSRAGKSPYEKEYLEEFARIIERAEQGVKEGMEETATLFRYAMTQLKDFFRENAKNSFLVRFLLEHQPLLRRVYGRKGTDEIFKGMFQDGLLGAYGLAARSYLQSGHYDLSSACFSKALRMDPQNKELRFYLDFSLGMRAYYENAYSRALAYFTKLVSPRVSEKTKKESLRKAEEVCYRISSELAEEKRQKTATRCRLLATQIKKML
jgi:tetratricopeptide (TPR) repeat protein